MTGIDGSSFFNMQVERNLAKLTYRLNANLFSKAKSAVASLFAAPAYAVA